MWDWHVDLGNILTILTTLGTLYKLHMSNVRRNIHIDTKLDFIWQKLSEQYGWPKKFGGGGE